MSIYEVLGLNIPVIAYSVTHQPQNNVTIKEYGKVLNELRLAITEETAKIQSVWHNHLLELTAKAVQTSRGNLSQFLSTPIQSDTSEIQKIIQDQVNQTSEQLLPKIHYGLFGGYDGRYILELPQAELPKQRITRGRTSFQDIGFKLSRTSAAVFESIYFIQGGSNLDIIEHIIRNGIGIYNSAHGNKINKSVVTTSALFNLLLLEGQLQQETDRFEVQIKFVKDKETYLDFHTMIEDSIKVFRTEIHDLNVSIWQRKLGLGIGAEYILRIRTKDRSTLRSTIAVIQKFSREKNSFAVSLGAGNWLVKEIV
jgi:hypothetical protein